MHTQFGNIDTSMPISAVEQALSDRNKLISIGTILQDTYGTGVYDNIFDSLLSSIDKMENQIRSVNLNTVSVNLNKLLTSNSI